MGVEAAVVGINVTPAKLLKQRRDLLDNVDLSVLDNLDVAQIVSLKRDIADLSVLNTKAVDEVLEAVVKRAIVESAIGRGHGPVLRWETHPNSLEGLPPGNSMPALLECRPLAVAHDHSPIVDWRCSQWARR